MPEASTTLQDAPQPVEQTQVVEPAPSFTRAEEIGAMSNLAIFESLVGETPPPDTGLLETPAAPTEMTPPVAPVLPGTPAPAQIPGEPAPGQPAVEAPPDMVLTDEHAKALLDNMESAAKVELDQMALAMQAGPAAPSAPQPAAPPPITPVADPVSPTGSPFEISDADFEAMAVDKGTMQRVFNDAIQRAAVVASQNALVNLPGVFENMFNAHWQNAQVGQKFLDLNPELAAYPQSIARALVQAKTENPGALLPDLLEVAKQKLAFTMQLAGRIKKGAQVTVAPAGTPGQFAPGVGAAREPVAPQPTSPAEGLDATEAATFRALADVLVADKHNLRNQPE